MNIDLSGKTAVVTGDSKGIGKAIAETLIAFGAPVGFIAGGKDDLEATAAEVNAAHPGMALAVVADVSDEAQMRAAIGVRPCGWTFSGGGFDHGAGGSRQWIDGRRERQLRNRLPALRQQDRFLLEPH